MINAPDTDSTAHASAFLFLGNDACLDYLNTKIAVRGRQVELLTSISDLVRWLAEAELIAAERATDLTQRWQSAPEGQAALAEARTFRAQLLTMVDTLIAGEQPPAAALAAINTILRQSGGHEQIAKVKNRETGSPELRLVREYHYDKPRDLLGPIAHAAANLIGEREWSRIKKCENPTCVLRFYDTTKNGSRHWCDTHTCGNRIRVANHYQRQRTD